MTLLDLFDASRFERGSALAVNGASYDALHAGSLRVAAELARRGLRRGERLALFCENRLAFVYAYLAALRLGAIVVPANVLYRSVDLQHVLDDARPALVLTSEATHAHVAALTSPFETVDAAGLEKLAGNAALAPAAIVPAPEPDDVAAIMYTSGTTGRSKGAMLTHGNLATIAMQVVTAWRWTASDVLYVALPLFHMHGLGSALNGTLAAGSRLVVDERFEAAAALAALRRERATMFFGVPAMYVRLLEALADAPPPALRLWVSGSAALPADVHRAFSARFGSDILERYGATEFGFACGNRFGGPRVPGSVGVPFPGTRVRVARGTDAAALAPGEVGELLVSGPAVFAGYWQMAEATRAAFVLDDEGTRWYRSGDLAQYDAAQDDYRIVGRLKELIVSGGFNIYPREIEIEIDRFPGVVASAVIGVPDAVRGELPAAFVEASEGFDTEALAAALRERLASFKIPKTIRVVAALPRNALGKIEKAKLADASFASDAFDEHRDALADADAHGT